jgi:hypothetical protein
MKPSEKMLNLAANYKFFTPDTIPATYFEDEYFRANYDNKINSPYNRKKIPEFLLNSEIFEIGEFCEIGETLKNFTNEHDFFFIEDFKILVYCKSADNLMLLQKDWKVEKYTFFPIYNIVNVITRNLNTSQYNEYTKKINTPNTIGVFTDKKVLAWVNYCNEYINALKQCETDILSKKNDNQLKIDSTIDALPGCKVERWKNYTTLKTDLFEIEFSLQNNGEYLSTKINYIGGLKGIINLQK